MRENIIGKLNKATQKTFTPVGLAYSLSAIILTCILLSVAAIQYANYVDTKSNKKWCKIIVLIDDRNKQVPARTEDQKRFNAEIHNLRSSFGCN